MSIASVEVTVKRCVSMVVRYRADYGVGALVGGSAPVPPLSHLNKVAQHGRVFAQEVDFST